ncbi:MAG: hypothetical protein ACJ71Q_21415 [Terriglobales bacterium]|jgi:hypothetical protein
MTKANVLAFLDAEIVRLQRAREILSTGDGGGLGIRRGPSGNIAGRHRGQRKRRRMSAEARRRISEAQKKRWAARKRAAK